MAIFEPEFMKVINVEGGYVNDPDDAGGPTKYGVTIKTLSEYLGRPAKIEEVKTLSLDRAKAIFKSRYWDTCKLDAIKSQVVAHFIFDQSINSGQGTAIIKAQEVVGAKIDGLMGPTTIAMINAFPEKEFIKRFFKAIQLRYIEICVSKPSQLKYIEGWINKRANPMLDHF